jgi:hypothetical protein
MLKQLILKEKMAAAAAAAVVVMVDQTTKNIALTVLMCLLATSVS